jgi:hypothetical protein
VPGALPPVIGWVGATGVLSREAWILFAIVFLWQMPHFLAIAWLYREDYARAGFPLLPVVEPDGRSTGRQAMAYAAALLPVSLMPSPLGLTTSTYFMGALALGLAFLALAVRFAWRRTTADARWLFGPDLTAPGSFLACGFSPPCPILLPSSSSRWTTATGIVRRCAACRSTSALARSSGSSARTVAARPRCSAYSAR